MYFFAATRAKFTKNRAATTFDHLDGAKLQLKRMSQQIAGTYLFPVLLRFFLENFVIYFGADSIFGGVYHLRQPTDTYRLPTSAVER